MAQAIIVAIIAGLTSALLSGALTPGSAPAVMLILLAPLPLLIAGFGWHPLVAALGGVLAALIVDISISERSAIAFAGSVGLPAFGIAALARRAFVAPDTPATEQGLDLGRIGLALTIYVALIVILSAIIVEPDYAALVARIRALSIEVALTMLRPDLRTPEAAAKIADLMTPLMLPMTSLILMLTLVLSSVLALQITARASMLGFSKPDLRGFRLPGGTLILLGLSLIVATRSGYLGAFGETMSLLLSCMLALQGLAVTHVKTLDFSARKPLLGFIWTVVVVLGFPAIIFLMIGIADYLLNLRRTKP